MSVLCQSPPICSAASCLAPWVASVHAMQPSSISGHLCLPFVRLGSICMMASYGHVTVLVAIHTATCRAIAAYHSPPSESGLSGVPCHMGRQEYRADMLSTPQRRYLLHSSHSGPERTGPCTQPCMHAAQPRVRLCCRPISSTTPGERSSWATLAWPSLTGAAQIPWKLPRHLQLVRLPMTHSAAAKQLACSIPAHCACSWAHAA